MKIFCHPDIFCHPESFLVTLIFSVTLMFFVTLNEVKGLNLQILREVYPELRFFSHFAPSE